MANNTKYVQARRALLQSSIDSAQTSMVLTEFLDLSGNPIVQADIGTTGYGTIEPNTVREEAVAFTIDSNEAGVAVLTLTRGLLGKQPYGAGGVAHAHEALSEFVISNNPDLLNKFTAKDNDETITGNWTFNVAPTSLSVTRATTTVLGNVKLSEAPAITLGEAEVTIATPGVVTLVDHRLIAGDSVRFTTTGALPTGLVGGTEYYVIATDLTDDTFKLSETVGGDAIDTTGSQSGVHTLVKTTPIASYVPANIAEAQQGGGDFGTPSGSNKFVTETFLEAIIDVQEFTSSGTWTKPVRGTYAIIDIIGAGGSGGAARATSNQVGASGGSGGAYRQFVIKRSDLSSTETVTIGQGGAAVTVSAATGSTNGNSGGVSWFKSTAFQASGGAGGQAKNVSSGLATDTTTGGAKSDILISETGGSGGNVSGGGDTANGGGSTIYSGPGGGAANATSSPLQATGTGGTSALIPSSSGGAGASSASAANLTATSGTRGGGGGGCTVRAASGNATSGAGGNGYVRVTVF